MTKTKTTKAIRKPMATKPFIEAPPNSEADTQNFKQTPSITKTDSIPKVRKVLNSFNGLSPREWTLLSRNIWDDVSSPRNKRHLEHGAVYPVKLAERAIAMYSGEGDLVFDPFNGIGSTLVAAARMKRRGLGTEPAFCRTNQ